MSTAVPEEETAPLLVSIEEAARLLSISTRTVYRLIEDASLPYIKLGRRTLVSVASLENWIADQEVGASSPVPTDADEVTGFPEGSEGFAELPEGIGAEMEAWAIRVFNRTNAFTNDISTLSKENPSRHGGLKARLEGSDEADRNRDYCDVELTARTS